MISVREAEAIILNNVVQMESEYCPSIFAEGRVLREEIRADRDFPPFDRVTMDGVAIHFETWKRGQKRFQLVATQFAGSPQQAIENNSEAIQIMTGAMCPVGCDTVVKIEDVRITEENGEKFAYILSESLVKGENLHPQAQDRKAGDLLVPLGTCLSSPEIGVAVSVGLAKVKVSTLPRVALISTGDELIEIEEIPKPYQIRRSNVYMLATALAERKIEASLFHFIDDKSHIERGLFQILRDSDILILSGGVSMGKADFVPEILIDLGVEKLFHQVKQRPGKPFWFGRKDNKVVFALPGNPVSTYACFYKYVVPYLSKIALNADASVYFARLKSDYVFKPELTLFLPVQVTTDKQGVLWAEALPGHGSGDFANLMDCNAFLELEEGRDLYPAGEAFPLIFFRKPGI